MGSRLVLLGVAALTALLLAAVQVLPTVELTRRSGRATARSARSVYELPRHEDGDAGWADGILCRDVRQGDHLRDVYQFSVGPWRLAEFLWPNVSGRQFPVYRRWLDALPAEGRTWVPSLYMGLLPLVLALSAFGLRRRGMRQTWLSWVVLVSLVASFGWYGLGWLIREAGVWTGLGGEPPFGEPVGGLYWLLTQVLPGYVQFRYPAKVLVVTALGLSLLAARGWDQAAALDGRRIGRWLAWVGGLSVLGAAAALAVRPFWSGWLKGVPADGLYGPLDATGAANDLLLAFVQTGVLCGVCWWLLRPGRLRSGWAPAAALVVVAVDLAMANGWMVATAPTRLWQGRPELAAVLDREDEGLLPEGPYRVYRQPIRFEGSADDGKANPRSALPRQERVDTDVPRDRLAEIVAWERDTLWPNYHLAGPVAMAEIHSAMTPYDYQSYLSAALGIGNHGEGDASGRPLFDAASVRYFILPESSELDNAQRLSAGDGGPPEIPAGISVWHNPRQYPRAWIVHRVEVLPPLESQSPRSVQQRTADVLLVDGRVRDLRRRAVVETDVPLDPPPAVSPPDADGGDGEDGARVEEGCRVVDHDPLTVVVEARLAEPGLVVLADQFFPGWSVEVTSLDSDGGTNRERRPAPILRTNRVMRGVWLPAGGYRLQYRYRPASFQRGARISGIAWTLVMLVAAGWMLWARHRQRAAT